MREIDIILTRSSAQAVQDEHRQKVVIWTVYESPRDFPGLFVIRPSLAEDPPRPLFCHVEAETLEQAREMLPVGVYRIGRREGDDPAILEVWI